MVNSAADSWTKYCNINFKSRKNSCSQKVVFIFCRNFAGDFFRQRRIFADFKTKFWKVSRSQAYIPISRWCYREHFLRKFIRKPRFCSKRCSTRAQSIVRFSFAAKKHTYNKGTMLIFSLEVHECFSSWNIKKIAIIYFCFWLISFCLQKTELCRWFRFAQLAKGKKSRP